MTNETKLQSGIYVPSKRAMPTRQEFSEDKLLINAAGEASFLINSLFWLSALTTFSFGFIASIGQYAELFSLPPSAYAVAIVQATIAGLIVAGMLDGTRYGWAQAEIAQGTQLSQQWIATIAKWLNFAGSLTASIIALPVLLDYLGIGFQFNQFFLLGVLKILIQSSMGLNIVAGMVYISLSPKSRRLASLAHLDSKIQKLHLDKLEQINQQVEETTDAELDKYLLGMAAERQRDQVAKFVNRYSLPGQSAGEQSAVGKRPRHPHSPGVGVTEVFLPNQANGSK